VDAFFQRPKEDHIFLNRRTLESILQNERTKCIAYRECHAHFDLIMDYVEKEKNAIDLTNFLKRYETKQRKGNKSCSHIEWGNAEKMIKAKFNRDDYEAVIDILKAGTPLANICVRHLKREKVARERQTDTPQRKSVNELIPGFGKGKASPPLGEIPKEI